MLKSCVGLPEFPLCFKEIILLKGKEAFVLVFSKVGSVVTQVSVLQIGMQTFC